MKKQNRQETEAMRQSAIALYYDKPHLTSIEIAQALNIQASTVYKYLMYQPGYQKWKANHAKKEKY